MHFVLHLKLFRLQTPASTSSGAINLTTGQAKGSAHGDSGAVRFATGNSDAGQAGGILLSVGKSGSGSSGDLIMRAGETLEGTGGRVLLDAGSGGLGGNVTVAAGAGTLGGGTSFCPLVPQLPLKTMVEVFVSRVAVVRLYLVAWLFRPVRNSV